ncbi:MAG: competence/damage-inducible protein A [Myxococcales bacterium]|nr:competence/damage-inducible protein A [Myxococcales bacterium]
MSRTAAALIIGNEILSGKIADTNTAFLARGLFELGIELRRVVVCGDEVDTICRELNALRSAHDLVFTSGGVGPTHDDVTIEGVAAAFGRPVVRSAAVENVIRHYYRDRATEAHFRMANMPEGAEMLRSAEAPWPTVVIENVYVLPGVPEIFELKFTDLRKRIDHGHEFYSQAVYTKSGEGEVASLLEEIARAFPSVMVGSYVKWQAEDYRTKVTFDGNDPDAITKAADMLIEKLDPALFVRREQ